MVSLIERIFRPRTVALAPVVSPEPEPVSLYTERKIVVRQLRANSNFPEQERVITAYLRSPELLKDDSTLGEFFAFWLKEFFQQADTGSIESLCQFIKGSAHKTLPSGLHQARREIFEPLFATLKDQEKEIFKNIKKLGLEGAGQNLAQALLESRQPLSEPLKTEYRKFVGQLIRIEAGIIKVGPAEPQPEKRKAKIRKSPRLQPATDCQTEPPPTTEKQFSFVIVLGTNPESGQVKIETAEELRQAMKEIRGLGPVKPKNIWSHLNELTQMDFQQIMERYGERVVGGPFKGWYEIRHGKKWVTLFTITDHKILFRVGPHEDVYATARRKPRDRSRSL